VFNTDDRAQLTLRRYDAPEQRHSKMAGTGAKLTNMWQTFIGAGMAVVVVAVAALRPQAVHACSGGPDWDPVAESHVIVGGQITSWARATDVPPSAGFTPIRVTMRIDHVWKGSTAGRPIIDLHSLREDTGTTLWAGSSGACGVFDEDPTGMYAVFGLYDAGDGVLHPGLLHRFYLSTQPYDPTNVAFGMHRLGLPGTGGGGDGVGAGWSGREIVALLAAGTGLAAVGGALLPARRNRRL
jgi:hypothetical protein